jgi:hypothetical protein
MEAPNQASDKSGTAKKFSRAKNRLLGRKGRNHDRILLTS